MKKLLLSALLLALPLVVSADGTEIDGIYYEVNNTAQTAEIVRQSYGETNWGETNWDSTYRFAPEATAEGNECFVVQADLWERLKTETFYVTVKGNYPEIRVTTGWWMPNWTEDDIFPGNELLTDNGDGTWTLTVNLSGSEMLSMLDEHHLLFTGSGYAVQNIYLIGDGSDAEAQVIVWQNGSGVAAGDVVIPETITYNNVEYTVTGIGDNAFKENNLITSISIPRTVTSIGTDAFFGCTSLTAITVDSENPVFDSRDNCNAIIRTQTNTLVIGCQTTVIPNTVTTIGDYAFYRCSALKLITIPNSVTTIGNNAFTGCDGLTSIVIPNSVTTIGNNAFSGCYRLVSATLPNSLTTIPQELFSYCYDLESIEIPNTVTRIDMFAFISCSSLTSITIPNSVEYIGRFAFNGCSGLNSLEIPNSVVTIDYNAFYNCFGLTSLTIPNSVTTLGAGAFGNCRGLTSLTLGSSLTSIGEAAFFNCVNLSEVTSLIESPFEIADNTFMLEDETTPNATRMTGATLYVPAGTKALYEATTAWNMFTEIKEFAQGDVNNDGSVGIADIVAITNVMAGATTNALTIQRADVNGDGSVGIADIVAITNIMAGGE